MGTTSDLKRRNVSDILRVIQQRGAISKSRVAKQLGLSPVTVHNLVSEMVERGICVPSGGSVLTGGRNAALYKVNGVYGLILGQRLTRRSITTTVYDLALERHYIERVDFDIRDPSSALRAMCQQLAHARDAIKHMRFLGAGIALPGRSDSQGVVMQIPDVDTWKHIPLGEIVSESLALPVAVDNDVNALAQSARWNGLANRFGDFVYLDVAEGIGTGVMFGKRLFRGSFGYGCEIGHTTIMLDGPLCGCGNRGCLQAFLDNAALLTRINERARSLGHPPATDIKAAIELVRRTGDGALFQELRDSLRYIAIAVEHLIRNFDPQAVIVRCDWLAAFPQLVQELRERVFTDFLWLRQDRFSLVLDDNREIFDAASACLYLDRFVDDL